ncbi:MAG TPA: DMT family transporter, partial [Thermoanaerobaculia bacterium]
MNPSTLRVHAALAFVSILFSLNYILVKIALREFDPLAFAWLRVVGSAATLVLIERMVHAGGGARFTSSDRRSMVLYAILGVVANQLLFVSGLNLTTAHEAAILITTIPIFTLGIALVRRQERVSVAKVAGIALAAAGALSIIGVEGALGNRASLLGDVMILMNCLSYALYLVLSKPFMLRASPLRVVTFLFLSGAVMMLPFSARALARQPWNVSIAAWLALAGVIAGPTVGAYLLNAWTLVRAESSLVAT